MSLRDDITNEYNKINKLDEIAYHSKYGSYYTSKDPGWRDKVKKVMDEVKAEREAKNVNTPRTSPVMPSNVKRQPFIKKEQDFTIANKASKPVSKTKPVVKTTSPTKAKPATQQTQKYTMPGTFVGRPVDQVGKGDPTFPIKQPVKKVAPRNIDTAKSTAFTNKLAKSTFNLGQGEMQAGAISRKPSTTGAPYGNTQGVKMTPIGSPESIWGTRGAKFVQANDPYSQRRIEKNAMNPSGAPTPVARGLDGKTASERQASISQAENEAPLQKAQPTLWQRVQNLFTSNAGYESGWGKDAGADAYAMNAQKRNAANARFPQISQPSAAPQRTYSGGAGAEGDPSLLGIKTPTPSSMPAKRAPSQPGAGAEGELIDRPASSTGSRTGGSAEVARKRMRDMVDQLGPGTTTTTTDGNTRTTKTVRSGTLVGGKLIDPKTGKAVNPEDQDEVDAANELRRSMQQAGGARGGAGISRSR